MGFDNGADNRWQGYSHQELYDMLHSGPGSTAAGAAANRWSSMAGALSDIQQDIATGVSGSGATWVGAAADSARGALGPLGDWAQQASAAADMMRISTELQGDLLGKARADMPVPVPDPPPLSPINQLITGQVDHEVIELAQEASAQRAYQVMAQYESGTTDNTSTLGEFGEPPALVVDTTPITGTAVRGPVRFGESVRPVPRGSGGARSGPSTERSSGPARPRTSSTSRPARSTGSAPREVEPTAGEQSGRTSGAPTSPRSPGSSGSPGSSERAATGPSTGTSSAEAAGRPAAAELGTDGRTSIGSGTHAQSTAPSSAPVESTAGPGRGRYVSGGEPGRADTGRTPSGSDRFGGDRSGGGQSGTTTTSGTTTSSNAPDGRNSGSVGTPITGAVVPSARRPQHEDEPDDAVHESKYLIEADDIYGDRLSYSPRVIGESRPRR
jgi:PPE family